MCIEMKEGGGREGTEIWENWKKKIRGEAGGEERKDVFRLPAI